MTGLVCQQHPILPSNLNPLGALPARFRRQRVLIVGCGDVGLRVARQLPGRAQGHRADLDRRAAACLARRAASRRCWATWTSPRRCAGWPDWPRGWCTWRRRPATTRTGAAIPRTLALLRALRLRSLPQSLVYGSTSGVYGDCGGERVDETRRLSPHTPRAQRRVMPKRHARLFGRASGTPVHILRIPGIYATDREGGTPRGRLLKGTPVLRAEDDVYTNHIHADDLARACLAALWRGKPQRVVQRLRRHASC